MIYSSKIVSNFPTLMKLVIGVDILYLSDEIIRKTDDRSSNDASAVQTPAHAHSPCRLIRATAVETIIQ